MVRAGFGQRRKTLANALRAGLGLEAERIREALADQGLPETVRAEAVPPPAWRVLAAGLADALEGQAEARRVPGAGPPR